MPNSPSTTWQGSLGALAVAAVVCSALACSASPAPTETKAPGPTTALAKRPGSRITHPLPILVPPTSGSSVVVFGTASDGSRYLVSHGLRMVEHPDGSLDLASEYFQPSASSARINAAELPERLGSGFVFYTQASGITLFWKAPTFTGKLRPLGQIDGEVLRLVPGPDRLYLQRERRSAWLALDPADGKVLDLAGLPAASSYGAMAFADEWFGAVEVPYRGLVATFDAGLSYRPVGVSATALAAKDGQLVVEGPGFRSSLGPDGVLRPLDAVQKPNDGSLKPTEVRQRLPVGPLGARPLELAVLRGLATGDGGAIVAAGGAVGRVRLSDGSVLELTERAYPGTGACQGVPLGNSAGFVCSEVGGKTRIYALQPALKLTEIMSFDGPRFVSPNGSGALVVRGSCGSEQGAAGTYCIVPKAGSAYELPVEGDLGVERVVALDDGRALVVIPPRLGAPGSLALVEPGGHETRVLLKLPKTTDPVLAALLKHGLWLDGFEQAAPDAVRGFIAGDGPLVGVRVRLDGKVDLGKLEHGGIDRALISGRHALVLGRNGVVETSDGGFEWQNVELPAEPLLGRQRNQAAAPIVNGCSSVGCAFGGWLRVGYGRTEKDSQLPVAPVPEPLRIPAPGGGRWSMSCQPTGEVSPAPAVLQTRPRSPAPATAADEISPGAWLPLWEQQPPPLPANFFGFDTGTEQEPSQLRAYVWGPAGADWGKVGQWQVRVADRHRVQGGVWSSSVSRSPWATAELAADTFGQTQSGNITVFRLLLDPSGRAGLLIIASRGKTDLFLVEEGRALTPVRSTGAVGAISSVVKLDSGYYVGATTDSRSFRVYRVQDARLESFAEYPDVVGLNVPPLLVTNTRRDALGLWSRAAFWYVHAVSTESGAVDAPLELTPAALSRLPRACSGDEDGWVLEGGLGVEPYVDFPRHRDTLSTRNFEARLVASDGELCASSLAAQSDEPMAPALKSAASAAAPRAVSVPMVLTDRHEGGRRWGFRCAP